MSKEPWKDWIPGVLSNSQLNKLVNEGYISNVKTPDKSIDYSSIDLNLTSEGYHMVEGSVKPTGGRYQPLIIKDRLATPLSKGEDDTFTLQAKKTYLFKIREKLEGLQKTKIHGQATAKSSIGRVDVLARLIVDGMDCYESFSPECFSEGTGEMYVEITPITFSVRVKESISLTQLRLFYDKPQDSEVRGDVLYENLMLSTDGKNDGSLSVDLSEIDISGCMVSAFRANQMGETEPPLDLWVHEEPTKPDPCKYWRFERKDQNDRLKISKGSFYLLRSKEKICLPQGIAVYCRAIDETIGEMRMSQSHS